MDAMVPHLAGKSILAGALVGYGKLFVGQRDAGHPGVELAGQVQAHAAPARSDVEHP